MERTTIEPGQDIVINVTLKNVSGKDIALYRTNGDIMRFVDVASGAAWVTLASILPPPAAAPPAIWTFKPAEEWKHTVRLGRKVSFVPAGGKPEQARAGLAPGRYRLEYSTTFGDHYPEKGNKVYTGPLQFPPIAFEIR